MCPVARTLTLSTVLLATVTACSLHDSSPPALPEKRLVWDNSPLVPVTPPPPELAFQTPEPPVSSIVPSADDWQQWQVQAPVPKTPKGRKAGRTSTAALSLDEPPVSPAARKSMLANGQALLVRYPYVVDKLYEIKTSPAAPTHLLLPAGQRLSTAPAINTDLFVFGMAEKGTGPERQEAVVLRPKQPGQDSATALLFQSGLVIYCKLLAADRGGMLSVSWDLPKPPPAPPILPPAQRPPKIDVSRVHTAYAIRVEGKLTPPWVPVATFDDGTRTYIRFAEALTYTRAPGVFGVTPQGKPALVQSHMYVRPDQPDAGAWLLVQGLWPALELKDSAGLVVKIVRQAQGTAVAQELSHAR